MSDELPTVYECQLFHAAINDEREAAGLEPLQYLDFDGAEPRSSRNCLSARNVYAQLGYVVGPNFVYTVNNENANKRIPDDISTVTDYFDSSEHNTYRLAALKDRLIEAGVVEP